MYHIMHVNNLALHSFRACMTSSNYPSTFQIHQECLRYLEFFHKLLHGQVIDEGMEFIRVAGEGVVIIEAVDLNLAQV